MVNAEDIIAARSSVQKAMSICEKYNADLHMFGTVKVSKDDFLTLSDAVSRAKDLDDKILRGLKVVG